MSVDEHTVVERTITLPLEAFYYLLVIAMFVGMGVMLAIVAFSKRRSDV